MFNREISICFIFLVCTLAIAGCDIFGTDEQSETVLQPLAVGNRWDMLLYYGSSVDTFSIVIEEEVTVTNGDTYLNAFAQAYFFNGHPDPMGMKYLYANRPDGLYQIGVMTETDTLILNNLVYPYPADIGVTGSIIRYRYDRWDTQEFEVFDTLTVELIDTARKIVTPVDTFASYVYKFYYPPSIHESVGANVYHYFVPGVGQVAQIVRNENIYEHIERKRLLFNYELK